MKSLAEKYRPKTWSEVVGQDKAVKRLQAIQARGGFAGNAFWITGATGTGKSTIGKLIADSVADEYAQCEYVGRKLNGSDIEELRLKMRIRPIGKKNGWAIIVNESHGLSKPAIEHLLDALESIPSYAVWIFTTTNDGQDKLFDDCIDAHPLLSRCLQVPLAQRDLCSAFAQRAQEIATKEGLNGFPIESYVKLVKSHRNNLRDVIHAIQYGDMLS